MGAVNRPVVQLGVFPVLRLAQEPALLAAAATTSSRNPPLSMGPRRPRQTVRALPAQQLEVLLVGGEVRHRMLKPRLSRQERHQVPSADAAILLAVPLQRMRWICACNVRPLGDVACHFAVHVRYQAPASLLQQQHELRQAQLLQHGVVLWDAKELLRAVERDAALKTV